MRWSSILLLMILVVALLPAQDLRLTADTPAPRSVGPAFLPDVPAAQPGIVPAQPWQVLQRMGADVRSRATLTVATAPDAPAAARALASRVADAWNAGDDVSASSALFDLGTMVGQGNIELTLNWHDPAPVSQREMLAGNVRISLLDTVAAVALAANADGSRLYAMISHDTLGGSMHLYRSTDKGSTWSLTQTISLIGAAPQMALMPVSNYLYVGYIPTSAGRQVRLRRFSMDTGVMATLSNNATFINAIGVPAADTLREVVGSSNILSFNNRLYLGVRTHSKQGHFFWADPVSDTLWNEVPDSSAVGVTRGLSIAYGRGAIAHHFYISYMDSLDRVCIDTANAAGTFFKRAVLYPNGGTLTSISAYKDTVLCGFDYAGSSIHVRYLISYSGGAIWSYGIPIDTLATTESPAVMIEKGQGMAIFYRYYTATDREGRLIHRSYPFVPTWTNIGKITDYTPHYWKYGIAALGDNTWGVLYITFNFAPALRAVIFAKYQLPATDVKREEPAAPTAYALFQNYPNPFNPSTEITYDLPRASHVTLTVFDVLGKEVARLQDGIQQAGSHAATWRATGISSGVYFYRLEAGDFRAVRKLVLMK